MIITCRSYTRIAYLRLLKYDVCCGVNETTVLGTDDEVNSERKYVKMKIVEASLSDMKSAPRGRRQRSPETQKLIDTIAQLKPGQARALMPEGDETVKKLRPRVSYAARAAGRKVRIVVDDTKVMFTLRSGAKSSSGNKAGAAARKSKVQAKALELGKRRKRDISAQDVIDSLTEDGVDLGVARPGTMVGAVLRSMPEFERTGSNTFKIKA